MEHSRKRLFVIFSMLMFIFIIYLSFIIKNTENELDITGLAILEQSKPPVLSQVPPQTLVAGQEFTYQLNIDDPDSSAFTFQDNTELFDVDDNGFIGFTPKDEQKGVHTSVVVVEDEAGNFDSILMSFNIT